MPKLYALIDVGSLKVKCEVRAYDEAGACEVLYRESVRTALARGLELQGNTIADEALRATISCLQEYKGVLVKLGVERVHVIGTEAIRKAVNADAVLRAIEVETGYVIRIITQEEEGELFFRAVSHELPDTSVAAIDIGGGSVQVVIGRGGDITDRYLFPTGTYLTRTTYIHDGVPTREGIKKAEAYIHTTLAPLAHATTRPEYLVYGSTNVRDFFRVLDVPLQHIPPFSAHEVGYTDAGNLRVLVDRIALMPYREREKLYPEEPFYVHGADMALFNILSASTYLGTGKVIPTNQNVSSGMFCMIREG